MTPTHTNGEPFLTIEQAANHLGMSVRTVRRMVTIKSVPCYQPSWKLYFLKSELTAWMMRSKRGDRGLLLSMAGGRR